MSTEPSSTVPPVDSLAPTAGPGDPAGTSTVPGGSVAPLPTEIIPPGSWEDNLSPGPNGPIPLIVVDQFGYRPNDPKWAFLRDPRTGYDAAVDYTPSATVAIVDAVSGAVVKTGAPVAWSAGREDPLSGDAVWTFDFSDLTTPGTYYVYDLEQGFRSPEFAIDPGIYREVLRHALRTFYYQRAGFEKVAATAGADWADGASHLGSGQDAEARAWLDPTNAATAKDLQGGWYDAGDYNKYTNWHARYIITLLRTFTLYPAAFGDDLGIPESGNAIPDVLDEVRFGVEWLKRMQNDDGSVLCIQGLGSGSPPSAATDPSFYGPATTSATLAGAAAFAYAARIFGAQPDAASADYATDLRARAVRAWDFAEANPSLTYFNNDEARQPGSQGLAAGQQEVDDDTRLAWKVEAAGYLFQQTGEARFVEFFDQNYPQVTPSYLSHWQVDRHEAALDYAVQAGATPSVASAIRADFSQLHLGNNGLLSGARSRRDAYQSEIDEYTWGSNQSKAAAGRLLLLNSEYAVDTATAAESKAAAVAYVNHMHGANALGLVFLTNMGASGAEHSAKTLYHTWFSSQSATWSEVAAGTPGPAPGFLVGGPNPSYALDACCTDGSECYGAAEVTYCSMQFSPPLGQPAAKAYLQFNLGWPANSWAVTENSNGYQTQYIRLLAAFVD